METDEQRFPGAKIAARRSEAGLVILHAPAGSGRAHGSVIAFQSDTVILGREAPLGGVGLREASASRLHARIVWNGTSWILTDLRSRNGTIHNGDLVEEAELRNGDELRIGDTLFLFVDDVEPYRGERGTALPSIVGGVRMGRLAAELERVARSDLSVLILGESGTGKEVVARALHDAAGRPGPFCATNTASIPTSLLESELFGHRRGAFTGADRDRAGLIRAADGGTLFLDEIGDMPLDAQAKLLRVLETREVVPLGATHGDRVDVRIICATHQDLLARIADGRFRGDLYARIKGYGAQLVPLRERKEDIALLTSFFLAQHGPPGTVLAPAMPYALHHYEWPYNVRELETAIRRAITVAGGGALDVQHFPDEIRARWATYGAPRDAGSESAELGPVSSRGATSQAPSVEELRALLERHRGNVSAVARDLGKDRAQVHRWFVRCGLAPSEYRDSILPPAPDAPGTRRT